MLIHTLLFHSCVYLWTFLVILFGVPFSFISPDYLHNCAIIWAKGCLRLAGVRIKVEGSEHLQNRSAVYIANHQSQFDILAMYACLPIQFRWMAKRELFDIPLFGMAMRRCDYIPIDRSNRRKAMQSMITAAQRIKDGTSVIVFPEGTRSPDGKLLPFKKGGFLIALKAQAPIVPIAIDGSFSLLPRGSFLVRPGEIKVTILPAVETCNLTNKELDTLINEVRVSIATLTEEKSG
ncbi:MAG TPA: lysophospholipid acyltransferase family protein [Geopsychrobacteraceae bacterium]|nr:lysophospholipid acyltransferase family protein [Geopsychrobacteraceae bacterium]